MFRFRLFFVAVLLLATKTSLGEEFQVQKPDGFHYKLIHSKLDSLEVRLNERFNQLEKQVERVEVAQLQLNSNVERQNTQLAAEVEAAVESKVSQMTDQISKLPNRLLDQVDCSELPKATSGLCSMDIGGNRTEVYQMHRFGHDWLTVLQRSDGSEDFDRDWADYRDGFGTAGQEFWLGLERLHVLTKTDARELLFELEDFAGNYKYARYRKFSIGPEQDLYRVNALGRHSGTAEDSFRYHEDGQFSALDKGPAISCVDEWKGGWWYIKPKEHPRWCYGIHLTGLWQSTNYEWTSILWRGFESDDRHALKFVRMSIRKM